MNEQIIERLESSFKLVAPRGPEIVDRYYAHFFSQHPELREIFPKDMAEQKRKVLASLVLVVENLRQPEVLQKAVFDLGRRHHHYGTAPEHYADSRDILVMVLGEVAGDAWNNDFEEAWTTALNLIAGIMIEGQKAEAKEPQFSELAKA